MSGPPSAQALPRLVNPRKFAYQDTHLQGFVASQALERLRTAVVGMADTVAADLQFYIDEDSKAVVEGEARVEVTMTCQRCLGEVSQTLVADLCLAMVLNDEQSRALNKRYDPWLVDSDDGSANLHTLVEDELLLALPMVAMHETLCVDPESMQSRSPNAKHVCSEKSENPFAVLKQLHSKKSNVD